MKQNRLLSLVTSCFSPISSLITKWQLYNLSVWLSSVLDTLVPRRQTSNRFSGNFHQIGFCKLVAYNNVAGSWALELDSSGCKWRSDSRHSRCFHSIPQAGGEGEELSTQSSKQEPLGEQKLGKSPIPFTLTLYIFRICDHSQFHFHLEVAQWGRISGPFTSWESSRKNESEEVSYV